MACALTQGYNLDCRLNYGGVKEAYVIQLENISAMTVAAGVITAITKVAAKQFYKYNLTAHTAEADDAYTSNKETGTSMCKQTIKFPINKMTTSVRNELILLGQNRLVWVIVDSNGRNALYGYEFGMIMTNVAAKTGKGLADKNGFDLTFEGEEKTFAYEVDSATLATLLTPGP